LFLFLLHIIVTVGFSPAHGVDELLAGDARVGERGEEPLVLVLPPDPPLLLLPRRRRAGLDGHGALLLLRLLLDLLEAAFPDAVRHPVAERHHHRQRPRPERKQKINHSFDIYKITYNDRREIQKSSEEQLILKEETRTTYFNYCTEID
jgi:hypothetical protein